MSLKLVTFKKKLAVEGIHVGIIELSKGEVNDIVLCAWAHSQQFHEVPSPALFWTHGYLLCTCQVQGILDKKAYTLLYPLACYVEMSEYRDRISVPNLKPEASIPIVKVVPTLLQEAFKEAIQEAEKTGETKKN